MKYILLSALLVSNFCIAGEGENSIDIHPYEKKICSQNGEDGVLDEIFKIIGTTNKYYVEFGVQYGWECNVRVLKDYQSFTGLMMDGDYEDESLNLKKEFVTAENINQLFRKYKVPREFDLLSIDIDFNDWHVWNAISDRYRPRVVVIEYNSNYMPNEDKVIIYNPTQVWDGTDYFGASILSYKILGNKKGYTLIYAENNGVNLFFIRTDILDKLDIHFKHENDEMKLYKPPGYSSVPGIKGHRKDPLNRPHLTSYKAIKKYKKYK